MKAVIIDDEPKARKNIINLIKLIDADIQVIGEGEDVQSGYEIIIEKKPDLVFLDIQMPDGSGFQLLDKFPIVKFKVIFITAFDDFAIRAFKYSAIDYLLKPIDPLEFKNAMEKITSIKKNEDYSLNINTLLSNISAINNQKIVLKTIEGFHVIKVKDIIRCESDGGYTNFILHNAKPILVSNIIKGYDEMLSDKGFLRPHQSHLINVDYIQSFIRSDGGYILMRDGSTVPVSKRKRESILEILEKWSLTSS